MVTKHLSKTTLTSLSTLTAITLLSILPLTSIYAAQSTHESSSASIGPVPTGAGPVPTATAGSTQPVTINSFPQGFNAFAHDATTHNSVKFTLNAPETLTTVAPFVIDWVGAGDYVPRVKKAFATNSGTGMLMSIDPATGAFTDIGPIAPVAGHSIAGMAADPKTGIVYASSSNCGGTSSLYTVNINTGAATVIGTITNSACNIAIAIDNMGQMYGYDIVSDSFMSIDKSNGFGTVIGPIGFNANYGQGLDFDMDSGTMYMAAFNNDTFRAELRTVDLSTGNTTLVGVLGSTVPGGTVQVPWLG